MAFGLLAGLLLFPFFDQPWYFFIPLAVFASLLPDIDHENSKINRMLPVTRWVPLLFKHRGFFHSIFPVALIYFGFHHFQYDLVGVPLAVGYLAHLLSDCITVMGCNLLHPFSTLHIRGFVRTDGAMEMMTLGGVMVLNVLLIARYLI